MADDVGSRFRHDAAYACCFSRQWAGGMPSQVREARTKELESSNAEHAILHTMRAKYRGSRSARVRQL